MVNIIIAAFITFFIIILLPVYKKNYGLQNFLWLSDIALFLTAIALWLHSPLLTSTIILTMLPAEILWNIDYFVHLFTKRHLFGITDYMFEAKYSILLRALSLFHIFLPIIWFWYLLSWGYDPRAIMYATPLLWLILLASYLFTDWELNINWVFSPKVYKWHWMPIAVWLTILMITIPIIFIWPLHFILQIFS